MKYWIMKSEPTTFSIDTLKNRPNQRDHWDGVRNYQARNMMRDEMKNGDLVLFYHSNCTPPGVAGIAKIVREAYPDHTAFDPDSPYFDPKSDPQKPRWMMVDVQFQKKFDRIIPLEELKTLRQLNDCALVQKGNRLSIMPISKAAWDAVLKIEATR
jgi:predicted RNA-binding protein with PUA-like domain